jgi:hypothetical protein
MLTSEAMNACFIWLSFRIPHSKFRSWSGGMGMGM